MHYNTLFDLLVNDENYCNVINLSTLTVSNITNDSKTIKQQYHSNTHKICQNFEFIIKFNLYMLKFRLLFDKGKR